MKNTSPLVTTAFVISALSFSGCSNLTPGENAGVFGGVAGAATGIALGASGVPSYVTVPVAIGAGAVVATTAYVIAKYQATAEQEKIAEQRAKLYYAQLDAEKKAEMKKQKVRYIAVDTQKDQRNTGEKAVMVFDTQNQQLVGNNVYDVKESPTVGTTTKFDTYSAQYVGSGKQ